MPPVFSLTREEMLEELLAKTDYADSYRESVEYALCKDNHLDRQRWVKESVDGLLAVGLVLQNNKSLKDSDYEEMYRVFEEHREAMKDLSVEQQLDYALGLLK